MPTNNIIVTGFGPFGDHKINASWEVVKLLQQHKFKDTNLIIKEVPVLYKYIDEEIPLMWKTYDPKLVVHVGVSSGATEIEIETRAFRTGYVKLDCENNQHPTGESCTAGNGLDCIQGGIDGNKICEVINTHPKVKAQLSSDAGRYLCEFIFYKSLNIDKDRTMFIHVPPLGKPYSAEELAEGLTGIIKCALEQLDQQCLCTAQSSF